MCSLSFYKCKNYIQSERSPKWKGEALGTPEEWCMFHQKQDLHSLHAMAQTS